MKNTLFSNEQSNRFFHKEMESDMFDEGFIGEIKKGRKSKAHYPFGSIKDQYK